MRETTVLDALDRAVIHALHVDGRAPFARIAAVVGGSPQTVARRYQRLRTLVGLRVVGLPVPDRTRRQQWLVRLTAVPGAAQGIARALAARPDTSFVHLASGGTEIIAVVSSAADPSGAGDPHRLLLRDVPRTAGVTAVSAYCVLHTYFGGPTAWRGRAGALTGEQEEALRAALPPSGDGDGGEPVTLSAGDRRLPAALAADGRAGYAELAAATGWSAATAARRVADLRARGALFLDVDMDDAALGVTTRALLWMSVPPARLDEVARTLAGHEEAAFVGATTGPTNLLANVLCPDPAALHRYLTRRLALDAVAGLESTPVLRTVKGVGTVRPW
ncbi:Lrp/AsnC family transcriptional regulator [Streptomyces huiliensis]|uniref:Lrp/AsnC family transcriptional regulator n=1 Tax=Streptomyces huiliensis TaxID=2876027 RepID=UPI001CBEEE96|nr:Lrp/AsnC family transcriptional regulator [Streptomyces huiliensis]MBZ4322122.1 Lrp/AsnC family transcriptional regulator [Streptomyces huiliensis]